MKYFLVFFEFFISYFLITNVIKFLHKINVYQIIFFNVVIQV